MATTKPDTSVKTLLAFLTAATKRLSSPAFIEELGDHLSKHPLEDRGAIFEQVVAHEYKVIWPKGDTTNISTEPHLSPTLPPTLPTTLLSATARIFSPFGRPSSHFATWAPDADRSES